MRGWTKSFRVDTFDIMRWTKKDRYFSGSGQNPSRGGHLYQNWTLVTFKNVRFDTKYQAFFCTFIEVQVSYVLDIINKDSSNNDIF